MTSMRIAAGIVCCCAVSVAAAAAPTPRVELRVYENMVDHAYRILRERYYDGSAINAEFRAACDETQRKLKDAKSNSEALGMIAVLLNSLGDQSARIIAPRRELFLQHGWNWTIVGNDAFVTWLEKGSEAEKTLKLGDRILRVEALPLNRQTSWRVSYAYEEISPRSEVRVLYQRAGEEPREADVPARVIETDLVKGVPTYKSRPENYSRRIGDVLVWRPRPPNHPHEIKDALEAARAGGGLVIDLRGLPFGAFDKLETACEHLFAQPTEICGLKDRYRTKQIRAEGRDDAFKGRVIVLIDAHTVAAAEVLAHTLQRSGRAMIMGDHSAGLAVDFAWTLIAAHRGAGDFNRYGLEYIENEVLLPDGAVLRGKGLAPDWMIRPTAADVAAGRDVVLSKALSLLKVELQPEAAATLFEPYPVVVHRLGAPRP